MHRSQFSFFALVLIAACPACEKKPPEPSATAQPAPLVPAPPQAAPAPAPAAAGSAQQEPLHITWVDPPAFKRVPPSNPMRKASFVVPRAAGDSEDGELTVFYFGPGQGGSIDANVDRWIGQMKQPDGSESKDKARREAQTVNGLKVTSVDVSAAGAGVWLVTVAVIDTDIARGEAARLDEDTQVLHFHRQQERPGNATG